MLHQCNKEAEISEIHTIVKRLDAKLDGKDGLFEQTAQFKGAIKVLYVIATLGGVSGFLALLKSF